MADNSPELFRKLDELQAQIQQANRLELAGRLDEAQAAYQACLQGASDERLPIFLDQLVQIWMGLGICESDRQHWPEALAWYLRAEAATLSAPPFNPDPRSPQAQANAQKWTPYLLPGLQIMAPQGSEAEQRLAQLCGLIAVAYENAGQLGPANDYYGRALDLLAKYNQVEQAAMLWGRRAEGARRRQQWFEVEQAGEKMLQAAGKANHQPSALIARRFLMLSQANQQRFFKALEHQVVAVQIARQLHDDRLAVDEAALRDLVAHLRGRVLERRQAEFLELLLTAEAVLQDPHLEEDRTLLRLWTDEQPDKSLAGALPVGPVTSLAAAAMVLEHFAMRHCGPPDQTEQRPRRGLRALLGGTDTIKTPIWNIKQQTMDFFAKDAQGQASQRKVQSAVLTLFGKPEVIITVALTESQCEVTLMDKRPIGDTGLLGFHSASHQTVPADADALLDCLNGFILSGLLVKTATGLSFVRPQRQNS